jgi:hypothetical protein
MPLPSSGAISLNQIHIEAGGSNETLCALNDADIRDMIGKNTLSQNAFSEYYGVSASTPSVSYRGRATTTGNGFPLGYINLSSGTKVVVICLQLAGSGNTYVNLGGTGMTLAAKMDTAGTASGVWNVANTGITVTNADAIHQQHLESASSHTSWYDTATPSGNRTYTITQTNPGNNVISGSTLFQIASASWK